MRERNQVMVDERDLRRGVQDKKQCRFDMDDQIVTRTPADPEKSRATLPL
jgi:hypothetical protein